MSWLHLNSLFFAFGGAIPIVIHLLHRQKYRRVRWAAMEWLLAAIKKTRRRLQLENLLLLLLRILIMIVLAMALARPYLTGASTMLGKESDAHYILAIDNSYSMEYKKKQTSSLDLAKKSCLEFLSKLQPSQKDRFTLLAMSEQSEVRLPPHNDLHLLRQRIEEIQISRRGSNMLASFGEIQKWLDRNRPETPKNPARRVYLFTDMQRNAWESSEEAAARRFPELLKTLSHLEATWFSIIDVGTPDAPNQAIVDLRVTNKVLTVKRPAEIVAEVHNFSSKQADRKRVRLLVDGVMSGSETVSLPPSTTVPVRFQYSFSERDAGPHFFEAQFDPQEERYDYPSADNHRFLAVDVKEGIRGLLVDGEPKDGKLHNRETGALYHVLRSTGYFKIDWITVPNFDPIKLRDVDFVALCNVKSLTSDVLAKLEEFVQRGGGLFVSLGGQVDALWYNRAMARCDGEIRNQPPRCEKCGAGAIPEADITREKRTDPASGRETMILRHTNDRPLPAQLGEIVGTPPDMHQAGVPRRMSKVDLDHPIFSLFKYKLNAQPSSMIFWKFFRLEGYDPAGVIADLDDVRHSPLLIEKIWHDGRVVLLATAIDSPQNEDWNSGIIGKIPYVPIVMHLCEYMAARATTRWNFQIGDYLQCILPSDFGGEYQLYPPGDTARKPTVKHPSAQFTEISYPPEGGPGLDQTGRYALLRQGASLQDKPVALFGVNVSPREATPKDLHFCEGNLETIPKEDLAKRYPDFKVEFLGERNERGDEMKFTPPQSELWRKLLFALLGFLVVESILACLFGRSQQ